MEIRKKNYVGTLLIKKKHASWTEQIKVLRIKDIEHKVTAVYEKEFATKNMYTDYWCSNALVGIKYSEGLIYYWLNKETSITDSFTQDGPDFDWREFANLQIN